MIAVELFEPSRHYETVCQWWNAQKWKAVPLSHLPKTGVIVNYDGKPAAAAWIFKTDSAFCWLEFIVASPEVRHEKRDAVLSVLISTAKVISKTMGFQSIFMTIAHHVLSRRIEAHGFAATDRGATNYVCNLSGGN